MHRKSALRRPRKEQGIIRSLSDGLMVEVGGSAMSGGDPPEAVTSLANGSGGSWQIGDVEVAPLVRPLRPMICRSRP